MSEAIAACRPQAVVAKSGLTRGLLAEPFLVSLYRVLAPYRGCGHGCLYCDGRAEKYYVEGDFTRDIAVRENLPALLREQVANAYTRKEYGAVCCGSGVTDLYQPLEARLGLARQVLSELRAAGQPLVLLTKNRLAERDFDILASFPQVLIISTITTVDADLAARLEPGASTPADRLALIKKAREAGFMAGVMAMPLCPGLSDETGHYQALLDAAKSVGAQFVYLGGLTLRPGRQKDVFLTYIEQNHPSLLGRYQRLYAENRQSGMPLAAEARSQQARLVAQTLAAGLPPMIPDTLYRKLLSPVDRLYVLMCHMQDLYAYRAVDVRPLKAALECYRQWLSARRTHWRRKRKLETVCEFPITELLCRELSADGLASILNNPRLAALLESLLNNNCSFDYVSLSAQADEALRSAENAPAGWLFPEARAGEP